MSTKKENNIEVKIYGSRKDMGCAAAERFAREIDRLLLEKQEINVVFAAAPSQNEFLEYLSDHNLPWSRINAFHMDEYIGLPADAPQGFGNFLKDRLFARFNFKSVHYLNGNAVNLEDECRRYSDLISQYPIDIVCMGIGENGHLAFNDPPVADFEDPMMVKVVELDLACRNQQVNDGCFSHLYEVPVSALTLTIPTLLGAGFISSVVPGNTKAQAVANTLEKEISTSYPSTILRNHTNVELFLDFESSQLLK
ncbi:glucosamine-6-phosphate deaminase [Pedobacter sp.]|uniref:glucosamine-6-phosphate deaminase n=1 Tax=Pedobacter sp. TaxID=1411316 RepID=UPI003BA9F880